MQIDINLDRAWLKQVDELKVTLIKKALKDSNGNQEKASKLLGCAPRTIRYYADKNDVEISKYKTDVSSKMEYVKILFELSYSIGEIAKKTNMKEPTIRMNLSKIYDDKEFTKMIARNKTAQKQRRQGIMNTDEILTNSRAILETITEKIKANKIDELSDEHLFYSQVLFKNGLMTKDGVITQEGIDVLYQ